MSQVSLQEVPQTIRDWFGSEDTVEFLIDLNQKLGIDLDGDSARIIPHLLYRLETKDIDPLHFIDQVAYWLQIPKEQAASIVYEIKEKLLNPIREQLNKFGTNISLIDVTHAKPLADILPQIHVNPRPPSAAYLARKAGVGKMPEATPRGLKDKLTVVEEKLQQDRGQRTEDSGDRPVIKINPTLLGLQKDLGPRTQDLGLKIKDLGGQSASGEAKEEKPFMLFGEEPKATQPTREGRKGLSMPFGFFNKDQHEGREPNTNNTNTKSRVVDYSGERERVTPFAKEEEVFTIKDSGLRTQDKGETKTPLEKMFMAEDKGQKTKELGTNGTSPKPVLETPPTEGSVTIKKNPFAFPTKTKESGGKPKVEGNTVHLG